MDPRWWLSQNIDELPAPERVPAGDLALAERRLRRWLDSPAFKGNELLSRFLAQWGTNEAGLLRWLSADPSGLAPAHGAAPAWLTEFVAAIAEPADDLAEQAACGVQGTLKLLWPLIRTYRVRMLALARAHAAEAPNSLAADAVVASMVETLVGKLGRQLQRTMVLEINIARIEGRLEGETPEARYENFVRSLDLPEVRAQILIEYPLLARDCMRTLQQWWNANEEFLGFWRADREAIVSYFGFRPLGPLAKVTGGMGDAHRNGRAVFLLDFAGGDRLVYKPRSLSADAEFQRFLAWLNDRGQTPPLRTFRILDRGDHGWTEYVPHLGCTEPAELERFYLRQGSLVALLYALGTTDMHLENLIASGEHPVVIDLETIFHPRFFPAGRDECAEDLVSERLLDSVMTIGLLPAPVRGNGRTMDKSALGATRNQEAPVEVDGFTGLGTDEVHLAKVPARIGEIFSQPTLNGVSPDVHTYREQVQAGFRATYELLVREKAALLAAGGPLAGFDAVSIRGVIRPSATYAALLAEGTHPKLLRNGFGRELLYSQLWDEISRAPHFEKAVASERAQLLAGDIPYFMTTPASRDLRGGDGSVLPNTLEKSGLEIVRERLRRMGPVDEAYQAWLIDAAFSSTNINGTFQHRRAPVTPAADYLAAARAVGDRLVETAARHRGTATWGCLVYDSGGATGELGSYRVGAADYGLYRGHAGIALFLAYLGALTGEADYRELAAESLATITRNREHWLQSPAAGAYTGLGAFVYLYSHLGALWGRGELLDEAERLLPELERLIESDTHYDMISGVAGCIPVLLGLDRQRPASEARRLAVRCGERLLERAEEQESGGISWASLTMPRGFSHGASGIAFALTALALATGEDRFAEAAERALVHERKLLADGEWSDVPGEGERNFWCHGAPGIALSRLEMLKHRDCTRLRADAELALTAAHRAGNPTASILCHGDLGNLETIHAAATVLGDRRWAEEKQRAGASILADFNRYGWSTPLPWHLSEPGLMMGLAGIGFGFLRLADPARVPSVLSLEPARG